MRLWQNGCSFYRIDMLSSSRKNHAKVGEREGLANEGFFHPMNWGMHRKAPQFLDDEEISSKAARWLRLNTGFKKGGLMSSVF